MRRVPEDLTFSEGLIESERLIPVERPVLSPRFEQPGTTVPDLSGMVQPRPDLGPVLPSDVIFDRPPILEQPPIFERPPIIDRPPIFEQPPIFERPPGLPPPGLPADPDIPRFSGPQTTTRLVTYAIEHLENVPPGPLRSAINFIQAKPQKVQPGELLEDLRQRTSFEEVLRERAEGWRPLTRRVFAEVFAMPVDDLAAMDAIVCVALLNRPDLEQVLRRENAVPPSLQELLENRKIVWQYPPPGTPLTPPYVIVVAVESVDTDAVEDVVQRILSSLVDTPSGFRLPRGAAQKLA
jgi:hypothetical protein